MGRKLATLQVDSALRAVRVGGPVDEVAARVNEPLSNGKVEPTLAKRLLRSTLFRNFMGLMSATVAGRMLGLLTLGYAARALGPEAYGLVGYGQSVAAYASIALVPGLANWGLRAVARDRSQAGTLLAIVNGAKLALAVLALAGVAVFVWVAVADPRQQLVVLLSCAALVTQAAAADWVLNGLELSRISAGIGVVGTAIYTAGLLALVHQPGDLYLVPGLNLVASALVLVPTYVYLVRRCGVTVQKPASDEVRAALVAAVPLGVTSTLVVVLHYANNFIVHGFLGPTELGVYLAAFRLVELAGTLPSLLAGAFFPRLARTVAQAPDRAVREARLFARVHMVPGFCIAAMAFAEAPAVIDLIYGAKYAAAVPLLRIMAVAILFNYATCGYTNCLISFGNLEFKILSLVGISEFCAFGVDEYCDSPKKS